MNVITISIKGSPSVRVYCLETESYCLITDFIDAKTEKEIENALQVKVIKTRIMESNLIGCLCAGNSTKLAVPAEIEKKEIQNLASQLPENVEILKVKGNFALGNLIAVNDSKIVLSKDLPKGISANLLEFFGLKAMQINFRENPLTGSLLRFTNKGFFVGNLIEKKEYLELKEFLELEGLTGTANYGDSFVGNDLIANSNGIATGFITTGFELGRIDEALTGK